MFRQKYFMAEEYISTTATWFFLQEPVRLYKMQSAHLKWRPESLQASLRLYRAELRNGRLTTPARAGSGTE